MKILMYLKYLGIFFLFVIGIAAITSLFSLTDVSSSLVGKIGIIMTALSFFIVAALASKKNNDKGYILGIKLGLIFVVFLVIVNLIIFKSKFSMDRIIYYTILIASGILGGSFGKNLKKK